MASKRLTGLCALMLFASGCAPPGGGSSNELAAACGSAVFSAYPVDLVSAEQLDLLARSAFDQLLASQGGENLAHRDWFIAEEDSDGFILFGSPKDSNYPYGQIVFESKGNKLEPVKWGSCNLQIELDGYGPAETQLDPSYGLSPDSSELGILMTERACANGGALNGRDVINKVVETEDSVLIVSMIETSQGFSSCPGNQPVSWLVPLDAPIGDRTVFDAGNLPPTKVVLED